MKHHEAAMKAESIAEVKICKATLELEGTDIEEKKQPWPSGLDRDRAQAGPTHFFPDIPREEVGTVFEARVTRNACF